MKPRKEAHTAAPWIDIQFITSSISTTLVLLLLGMVVFFVLTARGLSRHVKENIHLSLVIGDEMKEADILTLQQQIDRKPYARQTTYISKKQALEEQIEAMGTDPQEFLGYNPLRASIELTLRSEYANTDSIAAIEQQLGQIKHVQEVRYQADLIDMVNDNIRSISLILLGLAVLLTLISFALINNTIRLTIYSKRFLIHTMKLVGAGWGFIRKPFIWRNLRIGLLSAAIADTLLWIGAYGLMNYEPDLVAIITPPVMLWVSALVLLFGVCITGLCAYLSINKFLRMKAGTLYYI
ncbi:MAG: permease-like cell division protein FtsX [Prevotellaceae bacterium]|jgi:cell division transport system permease protein|nr:permease-like cell division protein FtsX [Prevotellaceae bacterium]